MSKVKWFNLLKLRMKTAFAVPSNIDNENTLVWLRNFSELKRVIGSVLAPDFRLPLTVCIDRSKKLSQMIAESGCFSHNTEINDKNFPINGTGIQEVKVRPVPLFEDADNFQALNQLLEMNLKFSGIEVLIAYWKKYPNKIRGEPIIALGLPLVKPNGVYYPYIIDGMLDLCTISREGKWHANSWIMAEMVKEGP